MWRCWKTEPLLHFTDEEWIAAIKRNLPEALHAANIEAFMRQERGCSDLVIQVEAERELRKDDSGAASLRAV